MASAPDRPDPARYSLLQASLALATTLAASALFASAGRLGLMATVSWLIVSIALVAAGSAVGHLLAAQRIPGTLYAVAGGVLWALMSTTLYALLPGLLALHAIFALAPASLVAAALTAGLYHQPWGAPLNIGANLLFIYMGVLKADDYHPVWFPLASFLWIASLHVQRTRTALAGHPSRRAPATNELMTQSLHLYAVLAALFIPFWVLSLARVDAPEQMEAGRAIAEPDFNPRLIALLAGACYAVMVWIIMRRLLRRKRAANELAAEIEEWDGETRVEAGERLRAWRLYEEPGLQGRVIQDYARFLGRLKKTGRARADWQTASELKEQLASRDPGAKSALDDVTRVYESARYGFEEIELDDYDRFQAALERLEASAR